MPTTNNKWTLFAFLFEFSLSLQFSFAHCLKAFPAFSAVHFDVKPLIVLKAIQNNSTMKVSVPKETNGLQKKAKALLPLEEDPELYKLDKTNWVSWDLQSTPTDNGSPTHRCQVCVLQGTETPRQIIRWRLDVQKVVVGPPVKTAATQRPVMEACMRPGPLTIFGGAVESMAQAAFDAGLPAALAANVTAGNNDWERAYRLAGNDAHVN